MLGQRRSVGEIMARAKWDARIGQVYLNDRVKDTDDVWRTEQTNVEREDFRAVFDMKNLLVGWMDFPTGSPPDLKLVAPGESWGDAPSKKHKLGVRLVLKMDETIDNSVRELMSTSIGLWAGLDKLHDDYLAELKDHQGELPSVVITGVVKTETPNGTSFEPTFAIEEWVPRPPELPVGGIAPATADKKKAAKQPADMDDAIPF